jgi:thiol-disulfide isomerase/thioredoxin
MRPIHSVIIAILIFAGIPAVVSAQDASNHTTQSTTQTATQTVTANNPAASPDAKTASTDTTQPGAPLSLGEIARLARAKKSSQPKSVKIFDDDNMVRAPLSAGEKAPGFASDGSSGGGKVTLLDFWATWCGPCRHALPGLKQLASVYGGNGFEVISVSEDEDEGAWHDFVAQNGMNWTQQYDGKHQMARQYGASALPTYILIGKDGTVVQQWVGDDPGAPVLERIGPDIKKALNGPEVRTATTRID